MHTQHPAPVPAVQHQPPPSLKARHILVADDDNTSRRLLAAVLRLRGAQVGMAQDGEQAITRITNGAYDLVFMDRHMPGIDGIAATRTIRKMGGAMAILPIIGMTAYDSLDERKRYLAAGLNDCLTKPILQPQLWTIMRRWLIADHSAALSATDSYCPVETCAQDDDLSNTPLHRDIVASLIADLAVRRSSLVDSLDNDDFDSIILHAHTITGGAAACGFDDLQNAASRLEGGARERNRSAIVAQMRKLFGVIDAIVIAHRLSA